MKRGNSYSVDSPYLRIRAERELKARLEAIANKRGGDPTSVAREGLIQFADAEEKRLGITPPTPVPAAETVAA